MAFGQILSVVVCDLCGVGYAVDLGSKKQDKCPNCNGVKLNDMERTKK